MAIAFVSVAWLGGNANGAVTINWGTGSFRMYEDDGTTLLNGDSLSSVGGFIQLLWVGTSADSYDGFDISDPEGLMGDDAVVATAWVGLGNKGGDGRFTVTGTISAYPINSRYVIRFFSVPSPTYASGLVPQSGNYGYTDEFVQNTAGDGDVFFFNFTQSYSAIYPVPEPGTIGLMLVGLGLIAGRRFRRKS